MPDQIERSLPNGGGFGKLEGGLQIVDTGELLDVLKTGAGKHRFEPLPKFGGMFESGGEGSARRSRTLSVRAGRDGKRSAMVGWSPSRQSGSMVLHPQA